MKKVFSIILRIICGYCGIVFLLGALGGVINCFLNSSEIIAYLILSIFCFTIGFLLIRVAFRKKKVSIDQQNFSSLSPVADTSSNFNSTSNTVYNQPNLPIYTMPVHNEATPSIHADEYIEHDEVISHPDNAPITDEEIPYLMQLGYEESLQEREMYNGEVLDLSDINNDLLRKKIRTTMPSYQELCNIPPSSINVPMFSTDIFFLKYLDGRVLEHPNIAQYWYYEYDINYSDEIKKLISAGLLTISQINLKRFKVDDLKNILRHFELPLSGKKADLQKRILENISLEELSSFLGDSTHYFCATDTGSELIKTVHDSATFNLELENEALSLILDYDYEDAFNLIWNYKKQTPAEKNTHYNYNPAMDELYDSIMIPCDFFYTLKKDRDIEENLRAAIVFCRMYGLGQDKVRKLIMRIYMESGHDFSEDAKNLINGRLL